MSQVLALDISSVTGVAFFENGRLLTQYQIKISNKFNKLDYPTNTYPWAREVANKLFNDIVLPSYEINSSIEVVIEQTNLGRNRISQAFLEAIHAYLYELLTHKGIQPKYMSSSEWRALVGLQLSQEDKKKNKLLKQNKGRGKVTKKHLAIRLTKELFGLDLLVKENNIADACLLGWAFILKKGNNQR